MLAGLAVAVAAFPAHALERVTLRNGFSMDCAHHETVGERMRLYTGPGDSNYQEIAVAEVAGIDILPDPPQPVADKPALTAPAPVSNVTPTLAEMKEMLAEAGKTHDIDAELLASVVKAESGFRVDAVSRTGARGLMQLMPGTAHEMGVQDVTRAEQNIAGGTAYLDAMLKRYKDNLAKALAAYNAGPAAVDRYHGIPPYRETQAYVARVIREFNRRKAALAMTTVASR